jgi:sodium/proline symporter
VILLSLYSRRLTFAGAAAGIVAGAAVDIAWLALCSSTGIYEIVPGFLCGLAAAVLVSRAGKGVQKDVEALFDRCEAAM